MGGLHTTSDNRALSVGSLVVKKRAKVHNFSGLPRHFRFTEMGFRAQSGRELTQGRISQNALAVTHARQQRS